MVTATNKNRARVNEYSVDADSAVIILSHNQQTVIDREDLDRVSCFYWHAIYDETIDDYYVQSSVRIEGRSRLLLLHRLILRAPTGLEVDHIDNRPLNNRKSNLRLVTRSQNMQNRKRGYGVTGFRNVYVECVHGKLRYRVYAILDGYRFGDYTFPYTPEGLAAANQAAIKLRSWLFPFSKENLR